MQEFLAKRVRERAGHACEYCQLAQADSSIAFEIDHVIAEKHHGLTIAENLALSCFYCNSFKGPNIAGVDPDSGAITPLFQPRRDSWPEHFRWQAALLIGRTAIGRTTIDVLGINSPDCVELRAALIREGRFPPATETR